MRTSRAPTDFAQGTGRCEEKLGCVSKRALFLGLVLGVALGFGVAWALRTRSGASVAARVNGVEIPASVLQAELQKRFGPEVLKDLIHAELIRQAAQKEKIVVPAAELEKRLKEMKANPQVAALLQAGQTSEEDLRRNLGTLMPLDALVLKSLTQDEEKEYLLMHRDELETVTLEQITVADEESAQKALEAARQPEADAGKLGFKKLEGRRDQLEPQLQEVFELKQGELSPVLQSTQGFHVFKLVGRKNEYKDLRPVVRERLAAERRLEVLEELRSQAKIETVPPYTLPPEARPHAPGTPHVD